MFGFSWAELFVVLIVVVICVDPKDIPSLARNLAEIVKKVKATSNEFTSILTKEIEEPQKFIKDLNGQMQPTYDISDLKPASNKPEPKVDEVKEEGNGRG